ncbi:MULTISPECIES: EscU/YscU/HrcU family type III secretion system export apparatus switch protein [Chelativorans]|jgi:flagellar biosynthesis protein FlhB|uniref:Type III secretion exporter n=1 Tax=Chelativorans sp. (strain BNC1) TaxID=266779 RepID=Q11M57_CHESB|nr:MULTISPECIES: EscU/YscU/HrcU family type III secretion system export apparatus switch protein [Chelativorans]
MSGEKTEAPTPRRLEERRREGQVPQRKNIIEAALLTFVVVLLIWLFRPLSEALLNLSAAVFSSISHDLEAATATSLVAAMPVVHWMLAICGASALFTLLLSCVLNKFMFAPKALAPKFERFNPVGQIKSIFSKATLYSFMRMIVLFTAVSAIFIYLYVANMDNSLQASHCGEACLYDLFTSRIGMLVAAVLGVLIVLALIDYKIQDRMFISQNKMTKEEVKREYKDQEGDREIKAGRKSIALNDAAAPLLSESTHVVHSDQVLAAVIFYPGAGYPPYLVFKAMGASVPGLCRKFLAMNIPTFNVPGAALEFYRMSAPGQYLPARSIRSMEKILGRTAGG